MPEETGLKQNEFIKEKKLLGQTGKPGICHPRVLIANCPSPKLDSVPFISLAPSVKRSNCYMVWGGDIVATSQRSSRSNVDLEIGCLVDLAMGMLSFSANGRELGTCYQVRVASRAQTMTYVPGLGA